MIERHAGRFVAAQVLNEIYERSIKLSEQMSEHLNLSHVVYEFRPAQEVYLNPPEERARAIDALQLARDAGRAIQRLSRFFTVC